MKKNKIGVSLGGLTKWNKMGLKIHDIFWTASPFSGVQSNTEFSLQILLVQRVGGLQYQ